MPFDYQLMEEIEDPIFYAYMFYTVLFLFSFLSQLSLFIQIRMHRLGDNLSTNLLINIELWIVASFVSLCRSSYMLSCLESPSKSAFTVLYSGTVMNAVNLTLSVSVTFMMLDRIFALLVPMRYERYRRCFIMCTFVGCFVAFFVHITAVIVVDLPRSEYTSCKLTLCLMNPKQIILAHGFRVFTSFLNLITSAVFNLALYKYCRRTSGQASRENCRRTNLLVFIACMTELFCNSAPHIFSLALTLSGITPTHFGPFVTVFASVDAFVTAIIYRYVIIKRVNRVATTEVFPTSKSDTTNSKVVRVK